MRLDLERGYSLDDLLRNDGTEENVIYDLIFRVAYRIEQLKSSHFNRHKCYIREAIVSKPGDVALVFTNGDVEASKSLINRIISENNALPDNDCRKCDLPKSISFSLS